jgi:4-amino-4-deoxy-L-arabinose transferase-like glycosyltransferase
MSYVAMVQIFWSSFINKYPHLSLLLLTLPLLLFSSGSDSLMAHDEGSYALQARWILESNNWLAPQNWGIPNYDRTIGIQWLIALSYQLFGISEFSARLPSIIACVLSVLLTYEIGKILINKRVGWLAAVILCLMGIWISESRLAHQNIALVCVELTGIWALLRAEELTLKDQVKNKNKIIYWGILAGTTIGLGFMLKGFMIALPVVAIAPYLFLRNHEHHHLYNPGIYLGLVIGGIPVAAWLTLSCLKYGLSPLQELFGKLLFLSSTDTWNPGPLYYFWNIPANTFPWTFFSLIGGLFVWKLPIFRNSYRLNSILAYPVILFVLLTCFRTRTNYYPLQLMPFMAILAAFAFEYFEEIYRYYPYGLGRFINLIFYAFTGFGMLLVIAGILLNFNTSLLGTKITPEIKIYGIAALILGTGWSTIIITWKNRKKLAPKSWLSSWFISPWLTIAIIALMGVWTNKSPELKASIQQPAIHQIIKSHPINFVLESSSLSLKKVKNISSHSEGDISKELILLSFYSPKSGKIFSFEKLPTNSYAWLSPNFSENSIKKYRIFGKVSGWILFQKIDK